MCEYRTENWQNWCIFCVHRIRMERKQEDRRKIEEFTTSCYPASNCFSLTPETRKTPVFSAYLLLVRMNLAMLQLKFTLKSHGLNNESLLFLQVTWSFSVSMDSPPCGHSGSQADGSSTSWACVWREHPFRWTSLLSKIKLSACSIELEILFV